MTTYKSINGPGRSLAQKIGDLARSALHANKPDNWNLGELSGDDFGYDFQVYAFAPEGEGAQCTFNIQLKGSTQRESRLADGSALSYPFKHSTLNLWHRSGFAVLVVIVDLIETQDPKQATVHYHLANYDLDDILPTLPTNQETVRLRVPTTQIVHKNLDVLSVVLPYLDEIADARREARDRRRAEGVAAPDHISIGAGGTTAPLSGELVGDEIEALIDVSTNRNTLHGALTALRGGDYERVLELCPNPTKEDCIAAPQNAAIVAHLRSMALDAVGNSGGADDLMNMAASLLPNCDDIAGAVAQKNLSTIELGGKGKEAREVLLSSLEPHRGLSVSSVKSKIIALNGDFDGARRILKAFPADKIAHTEIVISTIEKSWDRVLTEVVRARGLPALRPKQRLWLDALDARARFELSLRSVPRPADGEFIIPSTGLPQVDYDALRSAYEVSRRAMLTAQRLNWPADIQIVLDVFSASAMLLGYMAEAMPLLIALGLSRAAVTPIRENVAKLAVQFDQPEIALQLRERAGNSPSFKHEASVMAVANLNAGQTTRALEFVTDDYLADPSSKDVYLISLLLLGMSANSTLRTDLLDKIRIRLDRNTESRHYLAILDSAVVVQQSLLRRPDVIKQLYMYWSDNGRPTVVGYHLLTNADPRSESEARLFVGVAESLELEHSLGNEQLADYGQALLTIGCVSDAVAILRSALIRFRDDPKIQSMLGIALEIDGQSPEAFKLFEQLLNEGKASDTARRYFVEIAARMGFFDRAEQQVRAIYGKITERDPKLRLLNTLFQLLLAEGKRPEQIEEVAWEYGRLANQSDEREEGIFLQEYLVATLPAGLVIKPGRIDEFQQRLDAYSMRFPKSKFLWQAQVPTGAPPEAILAALQEAVGPTDRDIELANATELKMDRGALLVPFSWRPRRFLRNVTDLFMLWEIRKVAPFERAALHFSASVMGYDRQVPTNIGECEAVLSLTTILLLDELGQLALVLNTFPRLVVARATLYAFQEARNKFTSGWGHEKAMRVIDQLQKNFAKISHPPIVLIDHDSAAPNWHHEEKMAMKQAGRVYFCDDIVETYLVCSAGENAPPRPSISTIDFLSWADQTLGIFSPHRVADAIGHMFRLQIMALIVEQRYFIAAIPENLNDASSQAQAAEVLRNALTFESILGGVWNHLKPFAELRTHFAANMSYLLNETRANEEVLVTLWLRWLGAIRFQTKPNFTPLHKMVTAFLFTLKLLRSDKDVVSRLWCSFWTALQRGFGSNLTKPEDQVAIDEVGKILGAQRVNVDTEATAITLFERAKIGLESGTVREAWLNNSYIDAMVRKENANKSSR